MSCVDNQTRCQQALTRVAASRVRAVDAAESVRRGAQGCLRAFPLSGTALKMGSGVLVGLIAAGFVAKRVSAKKEKKMPPKPELGGMAVALQALSALAIPMLQRWLLSRSPEQTCAVSPRTEQKNLSPRLSLTSFSERFYRWLGLQK